VFVQAFRVVDRTRGLRQVDHLGGLTLSVLVIPIVILVSMEALRAVPTSIREAAYGVGPPGGSRAEAMCCPTRHRGSSRA